MIGFGGGGAENFVLELAKQNKEKGYKVVVIAITSVNKIKQRFIDANIEVDSLSIDKPSLIIKGFKKFYNIVKSYERATIHAHMFHAGIFASIVKMIIRPVPVIFTLHTNYVKQYYRRLLLFITKPLRNADVIFSKDSLKYYQKKNSSVICNGIDISRFNILHRPIGKFNMLFIGRLEEPKNPLYLVDLANILRLKYDFVISIIGEGTLLQPLLKEIADHKLESFFNILGFRNDIPQLLANAHCIVIPSLWEGMPLSILEAGSMGIPVISTPVGSIETILNADNGYLSRLENFHEKVIDVITDYPLAEHKGRNLQKLIRSEYDITTAADKYHHLYSF